MITVSDIMNSNVEVSTWVHIFLACGMVLFGLLIIFFILFIIFFIQDWIENIVKEKVREHAKKCKSFKKGKNKEN